MRFRRDQNELISERTLTGEIREEREAIQQVVGAVRYGVNFFVGWFFEDRKLDRLIRRGSSTLC